MTTLAFLTAVYNEQDEIVDLLESVRPYVDTIVVSDDGSIDATIPLALQTGLVDVFVLGPHLASCEEVRIRGIKRITEDWVLILDADERIDSNGLELLRKSIEHDDAEGFSHIYFSQDEYIDGRITHSFAKIKAARRDSIHLPIGIHDDISCEGTPINIGIKVIHRKTMIKQIQREAEYIQAYKRKIAEGKMTPQRAAEVTEWHYVVKE
jgi:glycosyltransferase involved in cell wall biosynthesis